MIRNNMIAEWKAEEAIAHIHGWDFSHIDGRYTEQDDLSWDYREIIRQYLRPEMRLLGIDTGSDGELSSQCGALQRGFAPFGHRLPSQ